jgi:type I restriction enzyme S subunit
MTFPERRLGDLVMFQRGFDITKDQQANGTVPIVSSSGIASFHNESKVEPPGVVIGRKGSLGTVHYLEEDFWPHDTTLWVKDFKGNHPRFISYFLRTLHLEVFDTGSSNPTLNRNHIHKIKVQCPLPAIQEKIAAILSAYDELIANNERRIALLEGMAEEVYREWFVRMRFPGTVAVPRVKGVPTNWSRERLGTWCRTVRGKSYASEELTEDNSAMPFVTLKSFKRRGGYRADGTKFYTGAFNEEQVVRQGDLVLAVTDMTQDRAVVGEAARIPKVGDRGAVISMDVIRLVPTKANATFLYLFLRYSGFANYIKEFANGANVLHLKAGLVTSQHVALPPRDLQEKLAELVEPLLAQADSLTDVSGRLSAMRDALLPRLISGKLKVDHLDIRLPHSMQTASTT